VLEFDEARAALPPPALELPAGTIVSAMIDADNDLALAIGEESIIHRPSMPLADLWLSLLDRRRSQLSHDLSGPATGVLAALETVLEYEPIPDNARALLGDGKQGMLRLTRLLDDRTALAMHVQNVVLGPLSRLLAQTIEPLRAMFDPEADRLSITLEAPSREVRVDNSLLGAALGALVSNAWKFRRGREAHVIVRATLSDEWLCVSVADDGRGMDEPTLRRAGEIGFTSRPSGAGLGLYTVRRALLGNGAVALRAERGTVASVFLRHGRTRE
jgi:signal transduction histidine kinase